MGGFRRGYLFLLCTGLVLLGFAFGYRLTTGFPDPDLGKGTVQQTEEPPELGAGIDLGEPGWNWPGMDTGESASREKRLVRVGPDTRVITRKVYSECRHVETLQRRPRPEEIGLDLEDFRDLHPAAQVTSFHAESITMEIALEGRCSKRFLALEQGAVAVFCGTPPKTDSALILRTGIRADSLPRNELNRLKNGVILEGDEEVARYLEGLSS